MQERDYSKGRNCGGGSGAIGIGPLNLHEIGRLQLSPCAVADVEHINLLLFLEDAVYYTINMGLMSVKQMPQPVPLSRYRAAVRPLFQTENGRFDPQIPFHGCVRIFGIYLLVKARKVALSMGCRVNDVCHASLQTRRKIPSLAASFLLSHPPSLDG